MSQSDYITHKKNAHILKDKENLGNVLDSQSLTGFKTFSLANTIYDESITYNELLPANKQRVFGMEMEVDQICPTFTLCKNTHTRPYRQLQMGNVRFDGMPRFTNYRTCGNSTSKDGYFWHLKTKEALCLEKEFKQCDDYYYRRRIWFKNS